MAISFSRPDPSSPAAIASATFATSRRGFDPTEVRDFLRAVSAELGRLVEREKFLERELQAVRDRGAMAPAQLDEDTVLTMLGEETARIVQTAREAALQIRSRAEDAAARLLREATDEAARVREEAELDAARRRQDTSADAEVELESAKQHGREMVNEAREYREKVLADVARRRELARQQIEQLVHGRDRLLQAFERARLAAVDVVGELGALGDEPPEFVNLSPTTGPVPIYVPNAASPSPNEHGPAEVVVDVELFDGAASLDDIVAPEPEIEAEPTDAVAGDAEPDSEPEAGAEADSTVESAVEPDADADADAELGQVVELRRPEQHLGGAADRHDDDDLAIDEDDDDEILDDELSDDDDERTPATVVALFAGEVEEHKPRVDDLFAKLRAASEQLAARDAESRSDAPAGTEHVSEAEPEVADTPFARRDEALVPMILAIGRKLKRALADEQNDVLDVLRRKELVTTLDAIVPAEAEHGERYRAVIDAEIVDAAMAGAASLSDEPTRDLRKAIGRDGALGGVTEAIISDVVRPLRERLAECVEQAAGSNDVLVGLVRAVYREWKTQRIDEQVDDIARMAYGRGAYAALAPEARVCWLVDPNGPACPDAEDNALGGVVGAGDAFPTGHVHPPAHPGCRCVLARVDS